MEFLRAGLARLALFWCQIKRKKEQDYPRPHKLRLLLVSCLSVGVVQAATVPDSIISTVVGGGNALGDGGAASSAMLTTPVSVVVDTAGNVFVADRGAYRIRKITPAGVISTVVGNGTASYNGEDIPATSAGIQPQSIAVDVVGNLYIAESHRIRKVSTSGLIRTVAGNGIPGFSGDGGQATAAQLYGAQDIALDQQGNLFIAESINNRVRRVTPSGTIGTIVGNGSPVLSSCGCIGDGGPAVLASINGPQGLAFDPGGNLYITELNGRVRRIDSSGRIDTVAGGGLFGSDPTPNNVALNLADLVFDRRGNAYFSNAGLVMMLTVHGSLHVVAGTVDESTGGFYGISGFSGDGGPARLARLKEPASVAVDSQNNLIVADSGNRRVRKISAVAQPVEPPGMFAFRGAVSLEDLTSYAPKKVVIGDVNGDNRDDIVFSASANPYSSAPYQGEFYGVGILLQEAGGTFSAPVFLQREWSGTTPVPLPERGGLALADFNNDGVLDIAVSHGAGIEFIPGSRLNAFGARSFSGTYTSPASELLVMDVNRDGNADLVAHTTSSATDFTQGIGIYFGNGRGEVSSRNFMAVPFPFIGLAAGDVNGDGQKDIVTGFTETLGEPAAGGVAVFLKNASNGFDAGRKYDALDQASGGVAVGDFNGDGLSDVVVGPRHFISITNLSIFSQGASGQLMAPTPLRTAVTPDAIVATDMNADGRDDLLVAHISAWALGYHQQRSGDLAGEIKYRIPPLDYAQSSSIAVGDLNSDGYKDAVVAKAQGTLAVLYGTGKRDGIRANGGQPLLRQNIATVANHAMESFSIQSLTSQETSSHLRRPVSFPGNYLRAFAQWIKPLREKTSSANIKLFFVGLARNSTFHFMPLESLLTKGRYSAARAVRSSVQRPESEPVLFLSKSSPATSRMDSALQGFVFRNACIRSP